MKLKFDMLKKCGLLLVLLLAFGNLALAQRTITGTLTDAGNGEPLIGANILVVGTSSGTVTDFDGNYSVEVPDGSTALEFSYTGYAEQTIQLGASNVLNVQMSSGQVLEEVVVVGYGTTTRKEVTSAVTSVDAEDFNGGNVNTASQLLQGKVSGLSISRPGGNPNGDFTIRLRGLSTVGANSEPLIVIDGVIGADLGTVDPNDIASMDVLKDGSAAAIYGTRGSSGVILITTKTGKKGSAQVDYNGQIAFDQVAKTVEIASTEEFLELGGPNLGADTDWFDELTQTGITQVHNLSFSGGTDKTTYRVSGNYRNVEGVAIGTGFNQLNARASVTHKAINDRLTLNATATSTNRRQQIGFTQAFRYATTFNPTAPVFDPANEKNGGYFEQDLFDYFNPVAIVEQNTDDKVEKKILTSLKADFEIVDGLTIGGFYSQQREDDTEELYLSKFSRGIGDGFASGAGRNGLAGRAANDKFNELAEFTANYNTSFGSTDFTALAGYSFQDFTEEGFGALVGNYLTDAFGSDNLGAGLDVPNGLAGVGSYKNTNRLIAFFGRVSANIDDTYFFSASLRREGSSRFGANNKYANFPAASAGVNISNLVDLAGVDNLKLRVGYGVTGAIPSNSYLSIPRVGPGGNFFFNGNFVPAYVPISNENPDLQWETKTEINVGLDFSFLDYKLNGSLEIYDRTTEDGILLVPVPQPPNLFGFTWTNVGEINNRGVELALNYAAISNSNFTWETGITASTFSTELVRFTDDASVNFRANLGAPGQNSTNVIKVEEGAPIGQIVAPTAVVGDDGKYQFQLADGTTGSVAGQDDFNVVGNGLPDFELGLNNSFTFGNFDLNFFLRGQFGHQLVNTYRAFYEGRAITTSYNLVKTELFDENLTDTPLYNATHVENASFLKLDNATIGYNFDLPDGSAFRNIRVSLAAQNPIVITNYTGVDPEARFGDDPDGDGLNLDILAPGVDRRNTYFRTRTFTLGVNLGF
ncbi:MAG: SusC/RagA family TonB-linked outer membrane protein [Saprospiraceae bacterium]